MKCLVCFNHISLNITPTISPNITLITTTPNISPTKWQTFGEDNKSVTCFYIYSIN